MALARAFGAQGERLTELGALDDALSRALAHQGQTLLELPLVVDPPWELS